MQLHADPRCMRSTSSDPVLTLRTGRKVCPGSRKYSRMDAGASDLEPAANLKPQGSGLEFRRWLLGRARSYEGMGEVSVSM